MTMKLGCVVLGVLAVYALAGIAAAQHAATPGTPNGKLEVAYRQLQDGKLSDSVHLLSLKAEIA